MIEYTSNRTLTSTVGLLLLGYISLENAFRANDLVPEAEVVKGTFEGICEMIGMSDEEFIHLYAEMQATITTKT